MQYDKSLLISMNLKNIKESIKIIFFLIILLFIMHSNRSFYNLYILAKFNIDERLTKSYGYCNNASYGFINEIYNEYSIKENILILNDNPNFSFNNSVWFKYIPNKKMLHSYGYVKLLQYMILCCHQILILKPLLYFSLPLLKVAFYLIKAFIG